jgi:hypothetical protein
MKVESLSRSGRRVVHRDPWEVDFPWWLLQEGWRDPTHPTVMTHLPVLQSLKNCGDMDSTGHALYYLH